MVVCQASKIDLPTPFSSPSSSKAPISLLFEPHSFSLALLHSDSSLSLFPSISFPFSSNKNSLTVPSPSSSYSFLLQKTQKNPDPRVLFIVAGPYKGGSRVLLRFFLYKNDGRKAFEKAKVVVPKQKGIEFDDKVGVLIDVSHGLKLIISGSVNFFALYSVSSSKVLIFGVKLVDNIDEIVDGVAFKLMKFAVIDCLKPVFSIGISFERLVLGEENGVKVWNLRELVKGKKVKKVKNYGLSDGVIGANNGRSSCSDIVPNSYLDGKIENPTVSVNPRSGKHRQGLVESGVLFVPFEQEVKGLTSMKVPSMSLKAISIQPLSSTRFLVLDTSGDLFVLDVTDTALGSNVTSYMRRLPHVMKVHKMAVFPDVSSRRQTVWISDGHHSMHVVDISSAVNETDKREIVQAIFTSEKIQDMIPMAANSILILGQGSLYAYTVS
ncbi:Detected protein of unknown function [Hibiscus syriacus]|uniref:Uncharacterized protein n=1 Tax=Hibiscus syriacus TaxID=106335 RepID=A0A6A2X2V8_HIBSY|nr:uncharacterized protein LOC120177083 [Hibiscus syriacus]XP_039039259.1 uncharacterized protein LOC120177083 [Hibiscus syriacus]KAE8668961.1 Detected protein of unknown function [Hibiscus syriacus]